MENEEWAVGSQPLFDDMNTEDASSLGEEIEKVNKNFLSSHDNHWLFKNRKVNVVSRVASKTIEELKDDFEQFIEEIREKQKKLPIAKWSKPIRADPTLLINDPVEYLFCDDTMKFKRKLNFKLFHDSEKQNCLSEPVFKKSSLSGNVNTKSLSRQAKEKAIKNMADTVNVNHSVDDGALQIQKKSSTSLSTATTSRRNVKPIETAIQQKRQLIPQPKVLVTKKVVPESIYVQEDTDNSSTETQPNKKRKIIPAKKQNSGLLSNAASAIKSLFSTAVKEKKHAEIPAIHLDESSKDEENNSCSSSGKTKKDNVECPMCSISFPKHVINTHAAKCEGPATRTSLRSNRGKTLAYNTSDWTEACKGLDETYVGRSVDHEKQDLKAASKTRIFSEQHEQRNDAKKRQLQLGKKRSAFISHHNKENGEIALQAKRAIEHPTSSNITEISLTDSEGDTEEILKSYIDKNMKRKASNTIDRATGLRRFGPDDLGSPGLGIGKNLKCYRCSDMFERQDDFTTHTNECLQESSQRV